MLGQSLKEPWCDIAFSSIWIYTGHERTDLFFCCHTSHGAWKHYPDCSCDQIGHHANPLKKIIMKKQKRFRRGCNFITLPIRKNNINKKKIIQKSQTRYFSSLSNAAFLTAINPRSSPRRSFVTNQSSIASCGYQRWSQNSARFVTKCYDIQWAKVTDEGLQAKFIR